MTNTNTFREELERVKKEGVDAFDGDMNAFTNEYTRVLDALYDFPPEDEYKTVDIELEQLCDTLSGIEFSAFSISFASIEKRLVLDEGSGVFSNAVGIGMVRRLGRAAAQVRNTKDVGRKCDIIASAVATVGGMVLISIATSGDKKGLIGKALSLLSVGAGSRKR